MTTLRNELSANVDQFFSETLIKRSGEIDLQDDQDLTEEFMHEQHFVDPEPTEQDSSAPWQKPQLV